MKIQKQVLSCLLTTAFVLQSAIMPVSVYADEEDMAAVQEDINEQTTETETEELVTSETIINETEDQTKNDETIQKEEQIETEEEIAAEPSEAIPETEDMELNSKNILIWQKNKDDRNDHMPYYAEAIGASSFDQRMSLDISFINDDEVNALKNSYEAFDASNEMDILLPLNISVFNINGDLVAEPLGKEGIQVNIYVNDIDELKDAGLYHYTHDDKWEELQYQVFENNEKNTYVSFTTNSFSSFVFAKLNHRVAQETETQEMTETAETSAAEIQIESESENNIGTETATDDDGETHTLFVSGDPSVEETEAQDSETKSKTEVETEIETENKSKASVKSQLKAPLLGTAASKQIRFTVVDRDGNPVSNDELNGGFDLYYYEGTSSVPYTKPSLQIRYIFQRYPRSWRLIWKMTHLKKHRIM